MPYEEMEKMIITADKFGFQIGVHAIGDKGNNWVLNAFEKAENVNGKRESRHRIEHAQTLQPSDIPRFASLGVIASCTYTLHLRQEICEKRIGLKGRKALMPGKVLLTPEQSWHLALITRLNRLIRWKAYMQLLPVKTGSEKKEKAGIRSRKSKMEDAIKYYTLGSAYAQFMEDRKGMIKPGFLADIVIVDKDLMTIPENEIMKTKVDYTITGGKVVYNSGR